MARGLSTQQLVLIPAIFGLLLIGLNVYQLWQLPWATQSGHYMQAQRKPTPERIVWIQSKNIGHLNHVINVFERVGFTVVHSIDPPAKWNVMWAFDFPFIAKFKHFLENPGYWQKINHLPGSGFVTLKVELATSKLPFIPKAFHIPKEKDFFLKESKENPEALWVQKSNNHRGIKIVNIQGLDLKTPDTFIQRFVDKPLLIDGRKFDIGVYVVITSVDPLRVYVHENDILLRFCMTDYYPFDVNDISRYVVGEAYTPPSHMPSLKSAYNVGQFSAKDTLFAYLEQQGTDTKLLWSKVRNAVRLVYQSKEKKMAMLYRRYSTQHNFFELVRFDFVIDEMFNIWLMEVNMSPNLSSAAHSENSQLYEQVIYNTLKLAGVASYLAQSESNENRQLTVNDRDIGVDSQHCNGELCLEACDDKKCQLCHQCLNDFMKLNIKNAYLEHINRGSFRRVAPQPLEGANQGLQLPVDATNTNAILDHWFHEKCLRDSAWCL